MTAPASIRPPAFRYRGPISELDAPTRRLLMERAGSAADPTVRDRTAQILERVRQGGDGAVLALTRALDNVAIESVEVPRTHWTRALNALEPQLRAAMERAARNIQAAHEAFKPRPVEFSPEPGVVVGRRPDPLPRVGIYAPGGKAAYPSSLLMGAIPARVAGVQEVIVCSPPTAKGVPSDVVCAAAALAGVDRLFAVGGAVAVGAMAFGTRTVPRVARVVGPGNAYVAEAKRQVSGFCGIDSPAGPSELLVIADFTAPPAAIARELLAQAEHDADAAIIAIFVGDGPQADEQRQRVEEELALQAQRMPRIEVIRKAFATRGALLTAPDYVDAVTFANAWAAEHLTLMVMEPVRADLLAAIRGAGAVFVGEHSAVAFGDYMTGSNHVLPTGGAGTLHSGLSTQDFVRWTSWQTVTQDAAMRLAQDVALFADAEGLPGHAAAARSFLPEGMA
jgi:histidinol dehydrogenase